MIRAEDYEFIFKRKGIRKYAEAGPDDSVAEAAGYIPSLTPLLPGIETHCEIVPGERLSGMGLVKAPHYAVFFSEEKPGYEANAGFMLQQLNLYFAAQGLGSCWVGAAKADGETRKVSPLKAVINMAFGPAAEPVHRSGAGEFTRKNAGEICDFGGDGLVECVRLAPSAMNSQPWFFTKEEGGLGVYRIKPGPVKALFMEPMNKIDMGVALCHAAVYCAKEGVDFRFTPSDGKKDGMVKNGVRVGAMQI